jgi:hypothetical protein
MLKMCGYFVNIEMFKNKFVDIEMFQIMKILENSKLSSWNSKQLRKFQRIQNLTIEISKLSS